MCALLEGCGRYLHRHRDSHGRTEAILELITKMRSVQRLPMELLGTLTLSPKSTEYTSEWTTWPENGCEVPNNPG